MVREAKKLEMLEAQAKIAGDVQVPGVAEAKGAEDASKGGKGQDDDSDDDDDKGYK